MRRVIRFARWQSAGCPALRPEPRRDTLGVRAGGTLVAKLDPQALLERIRKDLGSDAPENMGPLDTDDLADAIHHPKAMGVISELMEREESSVRQGEPAPDFTLPWLPGFGEGRGATLTLSDHFGKRPVALIFGSYT